MLQFSELKPFISYPLLISQLTNELNNGIKVQVSPETALVSSLDFFS